MSIDDLITYPFSLGFRSWCRSRSRILSHLFKSSSCFLFQVLRCVSSYSRSSSHLRLLQTTLGRFSWWFSNWHQQRRLYESWCRCWHVHNQRHFDLLSWSKSWRGELIRRGCSNKAKDLAVASSQVNLLSLSPFFSSDFHQTPRSSFRKQRYYGNQEARYNPSGMGMGWGGY